jgi:D-glycero-D-manno-heptose 1,7-bisphosphate phosphatase
VNQRALFLDRDGVINVDTGYVYRVQDFAFIKGIFTLCRQARMAGMRIFVITNQAGIGRGLYSEDDFLNLTRWMQNRFEEEGAAIDKVYHCPTHPQEGRGAYRHESPFRKPNPGMILLARDEFSIDLQASVLVGDKPSDIEAGRRAGVGTNILFIGDATMPPRTDPAVPVIRHLEDAIRFVGRCEPLPS